MEARSANTYLEVRSHIQQMSELIAGKDCGGDAIHESQAALSALSCASERDLRAPCYCEENVWRLAYRRLYGGEPKGENRDHRYYVVFVSNASRCCPMFSQLAQDDADEPCFWDYHVVLMSSGAGKSLVWDIDSHLPYPTTVSDYLACVFREECFREEYRAKLAPRFRVVGAEDYLRCFCSDRKHMIDPKTGKWREAPPDYDCILFNRPAKEGITSGKQSNLDDYIDMTKCTEGDDEDASMGIVYNLNEFRERFCS